MIDGGAVFVVHGSPDGLANSSSACIYLWRPRSIEGGGNLEDQFGSSLGTGYCDDAFDDLAVAIPIQDVSGGIDRLELSTGFMVRGQDLLSKSTRDQLEINSRRKTNLTQ